MTLIVGHTEYVCSRPAALRKIRRLVNRWTGTLTVVTDDKPGKVFIHFGNWSFYGYSIDGRTPIRFNLDDMPAILESGMAREGITRVYL